MRKMQIGWAQTSITSLRPMLVIGQMYPRVSEYVRDPITATALVLDNGETQAVMVSMDMTEFPDYLPEYLKKALSDVEDLDPANISISATHTHNSADCIDFLREDNIKVYGEDILPPAPQPDDLLVGEEAKEFLTERIADIVRRAWQGRKPGGIARAHEYAAIGFNRRPVFGNSESSETIMYGDCSRDDFIRFENGTDTSAEMLYTFDEDLKITGVAVNIPCPSQVFELHRFVTADYWGYARNAIRERLGNVYVLSLCSAAGDLAPLDLVRISKDNKQALLDWGGQTREVFRNFDMTRECEQIGERIADAVMRG
ncbi:MAG: hypothetical protein MJ099_04490 [Clostridia bacterium]|nr:hypothetical protein [Clostridia bacterium]